MEWGRFEVDTWYYSPYPEPYASQQRLTMCEFCLKYFRKKKTLLRHCSKCQLKHPPGDEIYRSPPVTEHSPNPAATTPTLTMFEVDGAKNKVGASPVCAWPPAAWSGAGSLAVLSSLVSDISTGCMTGLVGGSGS